MRRLSVPLFRIAFGLAIASLAAAAFSQDFYIGGSRRAGMGGAGLALPVDAINNNRLNPALLGFAPKSFNLLTPFFGYHSNGVSFDDLKDLIDIGSDGFDDEELVDYGLRYSQSRKDLATELGLGFTLGGFAFNGIGRATVATLPNLALQSGNYLNNPRLDAYAVGYYGAGLSYGYRGAFKRSHLAVGAAANFVHAYYTHQVVTYDSTGNNGEAGPGAEMDGKDSREKSGVGVDLGTVYSFPGDRYHLGAVVRNAIRPNIRFDRQLPNAGPIRRNDVDVFKTQMDLGLGVQASRNVLFAADWTDLGNNVGRGQLGLGAEVAYGAFALRAGYNSLSRFTVGASVLGFNVAFAGNSSLSIGTGFRF